MNFRGFGDYIEIFRGGRQTDSTGKNHDGDMLIDKALASFNAALHEPPAVIGHPKENAPAYGWVEDLKEGTRNGARTLMAKFKQVVPEFEEMVAKGLFKKRSASFYPDGRLRHVGFLGAMPPAVKGLADIPFADDDQSIEFVEEWKINSIGMVLTRLRDFFIDKFSLEEADRVLPSWQIEEIKEVTKPPMEEAFSSGKTDKGESNMEFTQEELDAKLEAARKEERDRLAKDAAQKAREKQFSDDLARVQGFCDAMVQDGKIAPAWLDSGLKEFMDSLAGEQAIDFGEGEKKTRLDWITDFFETQLPQLVEFKEVAGRDSDLPQVDAEFAEIDDQERLEQHQRITALAARENISYAEAADRVLA